MITTMKSERKRVTFVGRTNVGKSSLINALLGQNLSIVSPIPGTTTDPTEKAIEILPAGPLLFTDTAGIDDKSPLGMERIRKVYEILGKTDLLVIVLSPPFDDVSYEKKLIERALKKNIPYIFVVNKIDKYDISSLKSDILLEGKVFYVSALKEIGLDKLREFIGNFLADDENIGILDGVIKEGFHIVCITPVHHAYPKGRLKPLQVQVFREVLDKGGFFTVIKPQNIQNRDFLISLKPDLIILDAQAISMVKECLPENVPVTSFSMLFARYKGNFKSFINNVEKIHELNDGDRVAIIEACTHHRLEGDMGKDVLPDILKRITGKSLEFTYFSGVHQDFSTLDGVRLALHCGGCMITQREMKTRQEIFEQKKIPLINYGVLIAYYQGILNRFSEPLIKVGI